MTRMTIHQNTKQIPLTQGRFAIIDADMYDFLMQWKWCCDGKGYAHRNQYIGKINGKSKGKTIRMHRLIIDTPADMQIDHINGDKLDNRRENLRLCSHQENLHNKKKTRGKSIYKGVWKNKQTIPWTAEIRASGIKYFLGNFSTEIEAAKAYNEAAIKHHGEFARLNQLDA